MKQLFFTLAVCFWPLLLNAQHSLEPFVAYTHMYYLDRAASEQPYVAHRADAGLRYAFRGAKGSWMAGIGAGYGIMYNPGHPKRTISFANWNWDETYDVVEVPVKGSLFAWHAYAGRLFRLNTAGPEQNRLELGPLLRWNVWYADAFIASGTMSAAGLSMRIEKHHAWNRHAIAFGAELPLLSAVTRFQYHGSVSSPGLHSRVGGFFKNGTRFAAPDRYQELNLQLAYYYQPKEKLKLGLEYAPAFSRCVLPREVRYLNNQFRFLIQIQL